AVPTRPRVAGGGGGGGERGGSKPEVCQEFLRAQVVPACEDRAPLLQQSGAERRGASDPVSEHHDLAVEVIELAARVSLEALQRRGAVGAVRWKVARKPTSENRVAERHGKCRHQTKGARSAGLIQTVPSKLGGLDTFANRRDR